MTPQEMETVLNPQTQKTLEQVKELLHQTEVKTLEFQKQTGLHCKEGCGACCLNAQISTTTIEVLPLAIELYCRGQAKDILDKLKEEEPPDSCIFYQPDPKIVGNGRCGIYAYRPGVCRLFGFSSVTNKYGKAVLSTCKVIKETFPQDYAHAQRRIKEGLASPSASGYTLTVGSIDPREMGKLFPINQAIKKALEYIGLFLKYS